MSPPFLRRRSFMAAGASLALPASVLAQGDPFPSHPITLIAPSAPGGTTDITFRALAKAAEPHLGQPVIIDNKPGANTSLGVQAVSKGKPDGYQLAVMLGAVLRNQLMQKVNYNAIAIHASRGS